MAYSYTIVATWPTPKNIYTKVK